MKASPALLAFVARQASIKIKGVDRSREELLTALIAEQSADDRSSRVPHDGACAGNLPGRGASDPTWRLPRDYR